MDFWLPAAPNPARLKAAIWDVVARLRPGVTVEQAQAELRADRRAAGAGRARLRRHHAAVQSLTTEFNRDGRRILLPLFGAAALVLLIACGNVAALLLVRGLQRQQEYAVRSALGVGRVALFRQVAIESLVLALAGGALGVALAFGIVRVFKADRRTRDPASRRGHDRLAGTGVRTRLGRGGGAGRGVASRAARVAHGADRSPQERRPEEQRRTRRASAARAA